MDKELKETIDLLERGCFPKDAQLQKLLLWQGPEENAYLAARADQIRRKTYGNFVYLRGLIEFTSFCRNDCYYCGLRKNHRDITRYRLTEKQILESCAKGYDLDLRTFVLQGGEDPFWTDEKLVPLIETIRKTYPDCAITLSLGERSKESYETLYRAGADRYLLRHETASPDHYRLLHPKEMSLAHRKDCLNNLKSIGYQVGCGFMVGSPGQTIEHILKDLHFIADLKPHMIGIGPFIPAEGTPFAQEPAGSPDLTVRLLSILRLLFPKALLPATTALGTSTKDGRIRGIQSGANVIMPNLTPEDVRDKYCIYNQKTASVSETAESIDLLSAELNASGYEIASVRGDYPRHEINSLYIPAETGSAKNLK